VYRSNDSVFDDLTFSHVFHHVLYLDLDMQYLLNISMNYVLIEMK